MWGDSESALKTTSDEVGSIYFEWFFKKIKKYCHSWFSTLASELQFKRSYTLLYAVSGVMIRGPIVGFSRPERHGKILPTSRPVARARRARVSNFYVWNRAYSTATWWHRESRCQGSYRRYERFSVKKWTFPYGGFYAEQLFLCTQNSPSSTKVAMPTKLS